MVRLCAAWHPPPRLAGAVVYVNGVEVGRTNLPAGAITYTTAAVSSSTSETAWFIFSVPPSLLTLGANVIAVRGRL